jgi:hypothetical protein
VTAVLATAVADADCAVVVVVVDDALPKNRLLAWMGFFEESARRPKSGVFLRTN